MVEATPKDPYYAYGRRVVYIDKKAYWPYWGEVYSQAGEYWKTFAYMEKMGYTPGHQMTKGASMCGTWRLTTGKMLLVYWISSPRDTTSNMRLVF